MTIWPKITSSYRKYKWPKRIRTSLKKFKKSWFLVSWFWRGVLFLVNYTRFFPCKSWQFFKIGNPQKLWFLDQKLWKTNLGLGTLTHVFWSPSLYIARITNLEGDFQPDFHIRAQLKWIIFPWKCHMTMIQLESDQGRSHLSPDIFMTPRDLLGAQKSTK